MTCIYCGQPLEGKLCGFCGGPNGVEIERKITDNDIARLRNAIAFRNLVEAGIITPKQARNVLIVDGYIPPDPPEPRKRIMTIKEIVNRTVF